MKDKILGSLVGVALGDALGMPTEFMTQEAIREVYGMVRELRAPTHSTITALIWLRDRSPTIQNRPWPCLMPFSATAGWMRRSRRSL